MQQVSMFNMSQLTGLGSGLGSGMPFMFGASLEQQSFAELTQAEQQLPLDLDSQLINTDLEKALSLINNLDFEDLVDLQLNQLDSQDELTNIDLGKNEEQSLLLPIQTQAVLNLVEKIVPELTEVKNTQELTLKLQEKDISEENISLIMNILSPQEEKTSPKADFSPIIENNVSLTTNSQQQFSLKTSPSLLAEKVLSGQNLIDTDNNNKSNLAPEFSAEQPSQTDQVEPTLATKKDENLQQILALFKQSKDNDINNIHLKNIVDKTKRQQTIAPNTDEIKTVASNINNTAEQSVNLQNQENVNNSQNIIANNIISSEYKNLTLKFDKNIPENNDFIDNENFQTTAEVETFNLKDTAIKDKNIDIIKPSFNNELNLNSINKTQVSVQNFETNLENFDIQVENSEQPQQTFNQQLYKLAEQANINNQVSIAIKNLKNNNNQQVKIKLNPEELGNLTIELDLSDSLSKGVITVEKPEVAQQLAHNLKDLIKGFEDSSYKLQEKDIVIQVKDEESNKKSGYFNQQQEDKDEINISYNLDDDALDIKV